MNITELVEQEVKNRKTQWIDTPCIGNILESKVATLYYGTHANYLRKIFNEGIYANKDDGCVLCSIEPNTAWLQALMRCPLRESVLDRSRVVFRIDIPYSVVSNHIFINESRGIYEDWGKSDAEYYFLTEVRVPDHIPVEYIKNYMVKDV